MLKTRVARKVEKKAGKEERVSAARRRERGLRVGKGIQERNEPSHHIYS